MKPKLKRSISFPEDGQTPAAWLTLTVTLMICYVVILRRSHSRRQLFEQRLGVLQIERVEAFGKPAIDRSEKIAGFHLLTSTYYQDESILHAGPSRSPFEVAYRRTQSPR